MGTVYDFFEASPSRDLAIVGLALFLAAGLANLGLTLKTRAWFMLIVGLVGLAEMAGYACRIRMLSHPLRGVYIAMQCFLVIPPSFLALVNYIVLGRVVRMIQQSKPLTAAGTARDLKPKWLTWTFFVFEIISLAFQGAGAGISAGGDGPSASDGSHNTGRILLIIGLAALVFLILCFTAALIFVSSSARYRTGIPAMKPIFFGLYVTVTLLLIRNIFRLIEFGEGFYGPIARKEVYFYIFDALLMLIWLIFVLFVNFGTLLRAAQTQLEARSSANAMPIMHAPRASDESSNAKPSPTNKNILQSWNRANGQPEPAVV